MDFASAAAMMGNTSWLSGERILQEAGVGGVAEGEPFMQVDIDVVDDCRIVQRKLFSRVPAEFRPTVGQSFLDLLAAPDDFRMSLRATLNDIRLGVVSAPLARRLGGLVVSGPGPDGLQRYVNASGFAHFPGKQSRISLRLWEPTGEELSTTLKMAL